MTNPRTGYPDGYLIYLVKQIELGFRRPFEELLDTHGLTTAGYTALTVLQLRPGITSSELARRSFVRAQTMAETVATLTDTGLVRREKDPDHGRQILLFLTDAGTARVAAMAPEVSSLETRVLGGVPDTVQPDLIRSLRTVRDALTEIAQEPRTPTPA